MSAAVNRTPSASPSYLTVRRDGRRWAVQIVTPAPGRAIRTTIAFCGSRNEAIEYGQSQAAAIGRQFKIGRTQ